MVTRTPEWDDHERTKMLALLDYEAGLCACGFHESQTDPEHHFYEMSERVCPVCAGAAAFDRVQRDRDKTATNLAQMSREPRPQDPLPSDGRRTFIRRVPPPTKG